MKLKNRRLIGKYALWQCNRCGIEKEYMVSILTKPDGELIPTRGYDCPKCGKKGQMVFQKLIEKKMIEKINSFDLIREGIQNGLDNTHIIDELQKFYPDSLIENNIQIVDETRMISDSPKKVLPTEMKSNHFLVKSGKNFIDVDDGRMFKEYKDKNYSQCKHGLCKKLGTHVLKNIVKKSRSPSVFVAMGERHKENKSVRIKYQNENKKQQVWEFSSQEINECMKCIDEGKNDRQISIALFCPKECVQKLIKYIDINQKLNRSRNGDVKSSGRPSMGQRSITRKTRRKY